jgi:phosphatidylglycerol lysyltransferase
VESVRGGRRLLHLLLPALGAGIFGLAIWVLVREARSISLADIVTEFEAISPLALTAGGLLAAASYTILTLYDYFALRYVDAPLGYARVAPVSFAAFAVGHNVGLSSLSGGAIRYRAYSLVGLSASKIALVVGFIPLTYGLGAAILLGLTFLLDPVALKVLPLAHGLPQLLGVVLLAIPVLYLLWNALRREPLALGNWVLRPPGAKLGMIQCLLGSCDLTVAASVLYVLLHAFVDIPFLPFLGAYLLAMVAGVVSNVPGAVGVFESAMLLLLPEVPVATLLGAILAYRLFYYLIPLLLALVLVVLHEMAEHRDTLRSLSAQGAAWGARLAPRIIGATVFLVGAYLVIGAAVPLDPRAQGALESVIPVPLLEMSHLLSSAIGVGLLLLARGLYRRLRGAHRATVALLALASLAMFIHRDSLLQASVLLAVMALTWVSRTEFYRGRGLLDQRFDASWVLSIAVVLAVAVGLGLFVHRHTQYSDQLWWEFTLNGDASRMLRASLLAMIITGVFASLRLLHGRPAKQPAEQADPAQVRAIVAGSARSDAGLALLGDKQFLLHPAGDALVMYRVSGRSFISMGDPLGNPQRFEELAWSFRELCDRSNTRCVFYEVGESCLPAYIDLGLSFSKLGEEARVPLAQFDLQGSERAELRHAVSRANREGAEFAVIPAGEVPALMTGLRLVSDEWLQAKGVHEKGFSLGYFDADYLANFDCAVMRVDGQVVAFANLWQGAGGVELAVDLMRFSSAAPKGVMDALFAQVMLWGRERDFQWFNLGMAPLAGLEQHSLAPAWNKLGALVYRFGEHFYNFEGLRHYKQKFDPQWSPRYLASPGGMELPATLYDVTVLISGGARQLLRD